MEIQPYRELAKKILGQAKVTNDDIAMVYGTTDVAEIEKIVQKRMQLNVIYCFDIPLGDIVLRERGTVYQYYEHVYFDFYEYEVLINGAIYKQAKDLDVTRFASEVCAFFSANEDVHSAMDTVRNSKAVFDRGCTNNAAKLLQEIVGNLVELAPMQLAYTDPRGYRVWVMSQYYNHLRKQSENNTQPQYMKGLESFLYDYQKILSQGNAIPDLCVNLFDPSLGEILEIFDQCSHNQSEKESKLEQEFGQPMC